MGHVECSQLRVSSVKTESAVPGMPAEPAVINGG